MLKIKGFLKEKYLIDKSSEITEDNIEISPFLTFLLDLFRKINSRYSTKIFDEHVVLGKYFSQIGLFRVNPIYQSYKSYIFLPFIVMI